jgi:universal stress protein E
MQAIKSILVIVDPTRDEQPAVDRAALIAERVGAELLLFCCHYVSLALAYPLPAAIPSYDIRSRFLKEQGARMQDMADKLGKRGIKSRADVRWEFPLDEGILRKVSECAPDLVVKDTHHHTALGRAIFSPTDWNLMRNCAAALWLVKPDLWPAQPTLLTAVDPFHTHDKPAALDHELLATGLYLEGQFGGQLHVVHAYSALSYLPAPLLEGAAVPVGDAAASQAYHQEGLDTLMAGYDVPAERVHLLEGMPREALPAFSQQVAANLTIMGAVSRGRLQRLVIGSTAESVLDQLSSDVLIIKSPAA